jgi:hypothetical protein
MKKLNQILNNAKASLQFGPIAAVFSFFQGRATFFALIFTVAGIVLAFKGKLDANYALFVTAIQGLVFAHSIKEDYFGMRQNQQQSVQQNVVVELPPSQTQQ